MQHSDPAGIKMAVLDTAVYQNRRANSCISHKRRLVRYLHRNAGNNPVVSLLDIEQACKRNLNHLVGAQQRFDFPNSFLVLLNVQIKYGRGIYRLFYLVRLHPPLGVIKQVTWQG